MLLSAVTEALYSRRRCPTSLQQHGGLLISVYPFISAWLNINNILPALGNVRVHPMSTNPAPEPQAETLKREATQSQMNLEYSKSRMGTFVDPGHVAEVSPDEGTSSDMPDILSRRKFKQTSGDPDLP
ncbi:kinocilin isoform X2 [Hypomesus transpacificus]|uniref:kinocilin isoform X2 n=1 Tax=Hypomesus transpacificus TaxID=137520 RepID=UPI001F078D4A|nr:kinocilin isoform X2 [Hypomesus transpacificus]XP_046883204.1 kinocilin isoform X2 [Hypomesus transpacificus]